LKFLTFQDKLCLRVNRKNLIRLFVSLIMFVDLFNFCEWHDIKIVCFIVVTVITSKLCAIITFIRSRCFIILRCTFTRATVRKRCTFFSEISDILHDFIEILDSFNILISNYGLNSFNFRWHKFILFCVEWNMGCLKGFVWIRIVLVLFLSWVGIVACTLSIYSYH
jgi:hypothetical protein